MEDKFEVGGEELRGGLIRVVMWELELHHAESSTE